MAFGAVVLQDPVTGATSHAWRAGAVAQAHGSHPGNRLAGVLRKVDDLVGGREYHHAAEPVLECLGERVAEHGAEAEARGEYARGVHAEVLVQEGEDLVEEQVVLVVAAAPGHLVGVTMRCHEDGALLGALLVAVAVVMLVLRDVLGGTAHAVHAEYQAVGLVLVVVLGEVEVDFMLDAAASELEVVLERVVLAAALTRGGVVADGVAERIGLPVEAFFQGEGNRGVELGQVCLERVIPFGGNHQGVRRTEVDLQEGLTRMCRERGVVCTVGPELDGLLCASDADTGKVDSLCVHSLAQVNLAFTMQRLAQYLVAGHVIYGHVYGRIRALREMQYALDDVDIAGVSAGAYDGDSPRRRGLHSRRR